MTSGLGQRGLGAMVLEPQARPQTAKGSEVLSVPRAITRSEASDLEALGPESRAGVGAAPPTGLHLETPCPLRFSVLLCLQGHLRCPEQNRQRNHEVLSATGRPGPSGDGLPDVQQYLVVETLPGSWGGPPQSRSAEVCA